MSSGHVRASDCIFLSFNDNLDMPTRRPYSWKKNSSIGSAACERCFQLQLVDLSGPKSDIRKLKAEGTDELERATVGPRRTHPIPSGSERSGSKQCRFCTSHLSRVEIELQARLQGKTETTNNNLQQNQTKQNMPGQPLMKKFHVGMSTPLDACSLRCINFV